MMYSITFLLLAVSSSVSYSFIQSTSRGRSTGISSRLHMSDESNKVTTPAPVESSEQSAADLFAPVLSTLSESGEIEIDFDSLGK
jgi:hypothetical protein